MKIMIIGPDRHGKDTACEYLQNIHGLKFVSATWVALEEIVYSKLQPIYKYATEMECFIDRVNHREEWSKIIKDYNGTDLSRLTSLVFSKSDIYCGLRNVDEYIATVELGIIDRTIWVDSSIRLNSHNSYSSTPKELKNYADMIIDNNGTLEQLYTALDEMMLYEDSD